MIGEGKAMIGEGKAMIGEGKDRVSLVGGEGQG